MSDSVLIMSAAAYAAEAHAKQKRKIGDIPYVNHLLRVAETAAKAGLPDEAVAAALLHDSVEDTHVSLDDLKKKFPERVVELVRLMTQWWQDDAPKEVKDKEKPKYYGAISKDPEAVILKILDRADNLFDMVKMLPRARSWAEKYLKRSETEVGPLLKLTDNEFTRKYYEAAVEALARKLRATV